MLTGGGDCPGLNAVIRAIVRKGVGEYGHEFVGYRDGWRGPLERDSRPLGVPEVRGILPRGGTILGSSRTNPFGEDGGAERIAENLRADGVDGLIVIGGEDTLGAASQLFERGVNVVGVPKTIDNDLSATDYTFGFDTAVNIAIRDRPPAHDRGEPSADADLRRWAATPADRPRGPAGGANVTDPEIEFDSTRDRLHRPAPESQYCRSSVAEGAQPKGACRPRRAPSDASDTSLAA